MTPQFVRDGLAGSWLKPLWGRPLKGASGSFIRGHSTRRRTPGLIETKAPERACLLDGCCGSTGLPVEAPNVLTRGERGAGRRVSCPSSTSGDTRQAVEDSTTEETRLSSPLTRAALKRRSKRTAAKALRVDLGVEMKDGSAREQPASTLLRRPRFRRLLLPAWLSLGCSSEDPRRRSSRAGR